MAVFNLYKNNPSAGGVDGSKVVAGNPVVSPYLDLATSEEVIIKLALRGDPGYATLQPTVITPTAPSTTLAVEAVAGSTAITVISATGLQVGNRIEIGAGETLETKRITQIDGAALTLSSALANTQAAEAVVSCLSKFHLALAPDNAGSPGTFGAWGAAMTITDTISDTNVLIHLKVRALAAEAIPYNDLAASLALSYKVGAA